MTTGKPQHVKDTLKVLLFLLVVSVPWWLHYLLSKFLWEYFFNSSMYAWSWKAALLLTVVAMCLFLPWLQGRIDAGAHPKFPRGSRLPPSTGLSIGLSCFFMAWAYMIFLACISLRLPVQQINVREFVVLSVKDCADEYCGACEKIAQVKLWPESAVQLCAGDEYADLAPGSTLRVRGRFYTYGAYVIGVAARRAS